MPLCGVLTVHLFRHSDLSVLITQCYRTEMKGQGCGRKRWRSVARHCPSMTCVIGSSGGAAA